MKPWWLLAPVLAGTLLLLWVPALASFVLAGFAWDAVGSPQWLGLANLHQMWADPLFWQALHNSLWVLAVALPLRLLLALGLALLLFRPGGFSRPAWFAVFVPVVLPELAWVLVWLWMLNPHFGPAAALLNALEPRGALWLLSPEGSRASIVMVLLLTVGEMALVLAALRRQIPANLYAVSALEGASAWTAFRRITLPFLLPILVLLAVRDMAVVLQLSVLPSQLITKTGPQFATLMLPAYIHANAFEYLRFGYAAAMSLVLFSLVALAIGLQVWGLRRWSAGLIAGK